MLPAHVADTLSLAYDDFSVVLSTKPVSFVVPAMPRGSGNSSVVTFDTPYGKRRKLGARSDQAKLAFAFQQVEKPVRAPRTSQKPVEAPIPPVGAQEAPKRRGGRPRADGLESGSPEAKAADAAKRKAARTRRNKMTQPEGGATITELHPALPDEVAGQAPLVTEPEPEPAPERRRRRRPIS